MNNLRLFVSVVVALGSAGVVAGCSSSSDDTTSDATLHVQNSSDFSIVELHVAPSGQTDWGANLLGGAPLAPGDSLTLGVDCNTYDVLLVDDTNTDCEVDNINLCLNDADWVIHNDTCAVFSSGTSYPGVSSTGPRATATR